MGHQPLVGLVALLAKSRCVWGGNAGDELHLLLKSFYVVALQNLLLMKTPSNDIMEKFQDMTNCAAVRRLQARLIETPLSCRSLAVPKKEFNFILKCSPYS